MEHNTEKKLSPDAFAIKDEQNDKTKLTKSAAYKFNHKIILVIST